MKKWITLITLCIATACFAGAPVISSIETSGSMTWTNTANTNAHYRVEWASQPGGPWQFSFQGLGGGELLNIPAATDTEFNVDIPMYFRVRMITNTPPEDMVLIPGGTFTMGDAFSEGDNNERPLHPITISTFWVGRSEVSFREWTEVRDWAITNGYDMYMGQAKGIDHPVCYINWHDAAKWCNAKSEKEGRTPVYFTDGGRSVVYRTGTNDIDNGYVNWSNNGYRLLTEAEWEYAARGGLSGRRFPWGNTISFEQGNFVGIMLPYDLTGTNGPNLRYDVGAAPNSNPCKAFAANGYGLFGMADNMREWCGDYYQTNIYSETSGWTDPVGADSSSMRSIRGGSWKDISYVSRVSYRTGQNPDELGDYLGLRIAISCENNATAP